MITDLVCGFAILVVYLALAVVIAQCMKGTDELDAAVEEQTPTEDLLADQPVEVLAQAEVDRRFHALTRGGPHREWWT